MKNSKDYSKKVQWLYRSLKSEHPKIKKVIHGEVSEALVYGILSENMSEPAARGAIKRFNDYFVDLNDLRVSRAEEILELLGEDTPTIRDISLTLTKALRAGFNEYNTVNLESLKKIGKRPAKQALEKIEGTSRFVVNYCMLTSLQGHAIPLTKKMVEYLKSNGLVDEGADEQEIEGFLTKQIPAKNGYEFYALLRRESESPKVNWKKKTTRKTKAKTKTRVKKAKK